MRWAPGETAELTVTFTDELGAPVNATTLVANIFDPDDVQRVTNGVPVLVSQGFYRYSYDLSEEAALGLWRIEWIGNFDGVPANGEEVFEVSLVGVTVDPGNAVDHSRLRSRLAEVKAAGDEDGSGTFFTDVQISDLLSYAENDLDLATLEGWRRKMAHYARLVDVQESGTDRKMSQKFKNASAMVEFWRKIASAGDGALADSFRAGVVGRVVNLRCDDDPLALQTPFSGYSEHIRMYPTHRLLIPAILG